MSSGRDLLVLALLALSADGLKLKMPAVGMDTVRKEALRHLFHEGVDDVDFFESRSLVEKSSSALETIWQRETRQRQFAKPQSQEELDDLARTAWRYYMTCHALGVPKWLRWNTQFGQDFGINLYKFLTEYADPWLGQLRIQLCTISLFKIQCCRPDVVGVTGIGHGKCMSNQIKANDEYCYSEAKFPPPSWRTAQVGGFPAVIRWPTFDGNPEDYKTIKEYLKQKFPEFARAIGSFGLDAFKVMFSGF